MDGQANANPTIPGAGFRPSIRNAAASAQYFPILWIGKYGKRLLGSPRCFASRANLAWARGSEFPAPRERPPLFEKVHSARGSAAVEFAIAFPLQLFITFGIMQLAFVAIANIMVNHASFLAARAALVGEDPARAALVALSPLGGTANPGLVDGPFSEGLRVPGWGILRGSELAVHKIHVRVNDDPAPYRPGLSRFTLADPYAYDDADRFTDEALASRERLRDALGGKAEVRIVVEFDFELLFPVVDHLFAFFSGTAPGSAGRTAPGRDHVFGESAPDAGADSDHAWVYEPDAGYEGRGRIRSHQGVRHLVIARECSMHRGFALE